MFCRCLIVIKNTAYKGNLARNVMFRWMLMHVTNKMNHCSIRKSYSMVCHGCLCYHYNLFFQECSRKVEFVIGKCWTIISSQLKLKSNWKNFGISQHVIRVIWSKCVKNNDKLDWSNVLLPKSCCAHLTIIIFTL